MRALYILPHPDDESFGPAPAILKFLRSGHEVFLLTLTRGGATKQRHKFNYSIAEMGKVRYNEMQQVKKVLGLTGMTVLDLPDSGLKDMDPRVLEKIISRHTQKIDPHVLLTYPVHGISGFYDHLVCHACVKRVFVELLEKNNNLKRLAFFGLSEEMAESSSHFALKGLKKSDIDCIVEVSSEDIVTSEKALDCYKTYREVIERTSIKNMLENKTPFEFFNESFDPPLDNIFSNL